MAGLYFEDFKAGMVVQHAIRRTVTETDNVLFSALTYNCAPLHIDAEYSADTIYGQRLVNSMFLLALVAGVTVYETTLGNTLGNLGFGEIVFPKPTFHGDTIRVETEILQTRLSRSRTDSGIVTFKHVARNQRDEIVCTAVRTGLMMLRPAA
ncbi:transcriptional regulator [Bordetella pertussis]|uniref:Acyl dehydratase n=1 Tax=Bordetella pertussis (strain ATCC 9797 / DSM 5571 / CCUG 30873 / LMG 14455 / NCTC 10739 / 18323) TaxID=568706 RepID=A0A0T7CMQ7_BORP1|nr:MaoC family dehydratase [Bordetella pertussis]AZR84614.1 dehydratase [Bordetella pertussis]PNO95470.1 dehydratase [Bordetella pertussis 18323]UEB59076.1 MaoC family dehydratase [Bordetella pertussis]CCJ62925.1 Acyl dehydratase [Bordetella pertussis 18323]CFP49183.1 transcriptional regulator [Bordetella pertussis]